MARLLLRTPLARNLYLQAEAATCSFDACPAPPADEAYQCDLTQFSDELRERWIPLSCDEGCQQFILESCEEAGSFLLQILYSIVMALLAPFMSRTTVNGFLGRGSMFVCSTNQMSRLLHQTGIPRNQTRLGSLLDVGAGDGEVTKRLSPLFHHTYATEQSPTMRWRLKRAGFTVLDKDIWGNRMFDAVACLNILDRCQQPRSLLRQIHGSLSPGGLLILGMVFPLKQCVEKGTKMVEPSERLPDCSSESWEHNVQCIVDEFLVPAGFELKTVSRVPYLSKGDSAHAYYQLDEALMILQSTGDSDDDLQPRPSSKPTLSPSFYV